MPLFIFTWRDMIGSLSVPWECSGCLCCLEDRFCYDWRCEGFFPVDLRFTSWKWLCCYGTRGTWGKGCVWLVLSWFVVLMLVDIGAVACRASPTGNVSDLPECLEASWYVWRYFFVRCQWGLRMIGEYVVMEIDAASMTVFVGKYIELLRCRRHGGIGD